MSEEFKNTQFLATDSHQIDSEDEEIELIIDQILELIIEDQIYQKQ